MAYGRLASPSTTWIAAEAWDDFTRDRLWPQEWALRHWHTWNVAFGHLELIPATPITPIPVPSARDMGDDPRVWRLEYLSRALETDQGVFVQKLTFPSAESGSLGPSMFALQKILLSQQPLSTQARVLSVTYVQGRFTVRVALR